MSIRPLTFSQGLGFFAFCLTLGIASRNFYAALLPSFGFPVQDIPDFRTCKMVAFQCVCRPITAVYDRSASTYISGRHPCRKAELKGILRALAPCRLGSSLRRMSSRMATPISNPQHIDLNDGAFWRKGCGELITLPRRLPTSHCIASNQDRTEGIQLRLLN